jgi:pilus assembly protein CpaC
MKTNSYVASQIVRRMALGVVLAIVLLALVCASGASAAGAPAVPVVEKQLQVGASEVYDFQGIKRAAVAEPTIADYVVLSAKQIMISARAPGATDLYVWDDMGQHQLRVVVIAPPSRMAELVARITDALADPAIRVSEHGGVIMLEGMVESAARAQRAEAIASSYAAKVRNLVEVRPPAEKAAVNLAEIQSVVGPDIKVRALTDNTLLFEGTAMPGQKARLDQVMKALGRQVAVVDLVTAPAYAPRQILVRVKVVDVNKAALSDVGIDWGGLTPATEAGQTPIAHDQPILFGEAFSGPLAADNGGPIRRLEGLSARLKALVTNNKARVLAEPNLLVIEGETANMLVGGEIPIPVVQTAAGAGTAAAGAVTVEWKEFGVKLQIMGKVGADGASIDLDVTPEVSSLDFGNAIVVSNILLPALRTRRAHTVLHIGDGQTLVIGGLYQSEDSTSIRKVPLLGDIPIIGELFRRTDKQRRDTELVIFVTPEIVTEASAQAAAASAREKVGEGK